VRMGHSMSRRILVVVAAVGLAASSPDGEFQADRILNGDQTDWGLVFSQPTVLRVSLYTR
jgi:hypothetical protein